MRTATAILPFLWVFSAQADVPTRMREALDLPRAAQDLREAGVPDTDVRKAIEVARDNKMPADEFGVVLRSAKEDATQYGKLENFGQFVQEAHEKGLRGKDLAAAIHEEHAARGMGSEKEGGPDDKGPEGKGPDDKGGPPEGKGPDDKGGPPEGKGPDDKGAPPDDKGAKEDHGGKPEEKGAPEGKGRPDEKGKTP